jgi:hypothetical protein
MLRLANDNERGHEPMRMLFLFDFNLLFFNQILIIFLLFLLFLAFLSTLFIFFLPAAYFHPGSDGKNSNEYTSQVVHGMVVSGVNSSSKLKMMRRIKYQCINLFEI